MQAWFVPRGGPDWPVTVLSGKSTVERLPVAAATIETLPTAASDGDM